MKVLFVGVGSIARRHVRNLVTMYSEIKIDLFRSGKGDLLSEDIRKLVGNVFYDYEEIPDTYDVIFITNPTQYHLETFIRFHNKGKHFFIEKPVFTDVDINIAELQLRKNSIYYVACPLRYNSVIRYVKDSIDLSKVYNARCICSSYLPDWRPGTDYRKVYSAHKEMGGGVAIDLVHEWDYLTWLFGYPNEVYSCIDKVSALEIDSDDLALYIGKYDRLCIELHLDYFGRKSMRNIQLFTAEDTIEADILNGTVSYLSSGKRVSFQGDRDTFQKEELQHFFDMINGKCINDNSIENAVKVLRIARGEWG